MEEPFRGVERPRDMWRSVLLGVVLAGLLAGCSLGGGHSAGKSAPTVQTAVVVRVRSSLDTPGWSARWTINCDSKAAWTMQVCAAVAARPSGFVDTAYSPDCSGSVPLTQMRVDGTIAGRPVHLTEDSTCGPLGVHAWYALLKRLHLYKPKAA